MGWALLVEGGLNVKTFESGGDVRPIDEILDGTLHVKALRAELGGLLDEAQVMRNILEESNKMLVAAMEQSRKDAYKLQEQSAIITDLGAKLDAANVELHELRIRAGRVAELEAWVVRAQDAFRRALLLEIPSQELKELRDNAPVPQQ